LEVFESIAREFAELVRPKGDLYADDVVRILGQNAFRAGLDPVFAVEAVCAAMLGTRPPRDDDLRQIQLDAVVGWFAEGWADG
jgi:hypothetical protein